MKIAVLEVDGILRFLKDTFIDSDDEEKSNFLGYIDLPIEKPKKTVVKEAEATDGEFIASTGEIIQNYRFPKNAKNIKCTYEVEE